MADQEYNGESGNTQYDGEQQMYTQDSGFENGPSGDGEEKKRDDDDRKIFVGGLSWETTQKDLKDYFGNFGDVVDTTLKTDPMTHRSRGFGFVLFSDKSAVDKVVNQGEPHSLHGRNIDPKRAHARPKPEPVKKVFVGGIDGSTSEEVIRDYFNQFGKVVELDLPFDKIKGQRRAFCFITFDDESSVEKACTNTKQIVGGKEVDVKKATPRQDGQGGWGQQQGWGGRGGRGGYDRGGRGGRGRGRGGQSQGWGQQGGGGWGGSGQQGYDYYGGNNYNQQYGYNGSTGSYDYYQQTNPSYNNYNYDYYNQGWGNYGQGGSYGSYGNNSSGYDGSYGGWYTSQSGQQPSGGQQQTQQASNYGKQKATGQGGGRGGGYHPYARQ